MSVFREARRRDPSRTLRNWWTASFGVSACFLFALFWLAAVLDSLGPEGETYRWEWFFYSLFHPAAYWFFLKATFFTHIELKGDTVVVKNFLVKHVIPVHLVSEVLWEGGVDVVLVDGSKWWCLNLGGSLIGALAGYPTNRRCARSIEHFLSRKRLQQAETDDVGVVTTPHLNLFFLVGASLASFVSMYLLSLII